MDDSLLYLHRSLLDQLKETATEFFNAFSEAYKNLNEDIDKAEEMFKSIINKANTILSPLPFYNDQFVGMDRSEDFFYIIQILSLCIKSTHNLYVISRHNKNETSMAIYEKISHHYKGLIFYYYHLVYLFDINKKVKEVVDVFYKEVNFTLLDRALGDMCLLDFCLRNYLLNTYLSYELKNEYKHYFKAYQEMKLLDNYEMDKISNSLGLLLSRRIKEDKVAKIIYESIFFECIVLEYAYKSKDDELVNEVFNIGYDYYLEIDTLYIVYQYDHDRYLNYFKELKYISLSRLISLCDENGYNHNLVKGLFPESFLLETLAYSKENIAKIDRNDKSDYRNKDNRDTPERFK